MSTDKTLLTITNKDHYHFNESGWLEDQDEQEKAKHPDLHLLKLSNCQHNKSECFVLLKDLVDPSAPPVEPEQAAVSGEVMPATPTPVPAGRPAVWGDEVVGRLEWAFEQGYNVTEACFFVGIHRDTYYDWLQKHDGFSDKMEWAKQALARKAKDTVRTAIASGDQQTARWYLDRRDPDFKPKTEVSPSLGFKETRDKIKDFLDEPHNDSPPGESDAPSAELAAEATDSGGVEVAAATPDIS